MNLKNITTNTIIRALCEQEEIVNAMRNHEQYGNWEAANELRKVLYGKPDNWFIQWLKNRLIQKANQD